MDRRARPAAAGVLGGVGLLFLLAAGAPGCVADPTREGVGSYCSRDEQCLQGLSCIERECREWGSPRDAAAAVDAGASPSDAGTTPDGGGTPESDAGSDAGAPPVDSGIDAGTAPDAGIELDAAVDLDAGIELDASTLVALDAGVDARGRP